MLMGILCRICRCLPVGPREREPSAKPVGDAGIGITVQNRLNRAGITTYAQLAAAKPEHVREALGKLSRGASVDAWISQARKLVASK